MEASGKWWIKKKKQSWMVYRWKALPPSWEPFLSLLFLGNIVLPSIYKSAIWVLILQLSFFPRICLNSLSVLILHRFVVLIATNILLTTFSILITVGNFQESDFVVVIEWSYVLYNVIFVVYFLKLILIKALQKYIK